MKYRAVLIEPGNATRERPHQMLTNSWDEIKSWTEKALRNSPDPNAHVDQFETIERKIAFVPKAAKEVQPV